ncbi:hypothetical protein GCM10009430_07090 [Aquimarina litoralis]|uniref:TonB-dependent receptor plug domain-containing protein n=1 Tax=Aquimarina litoralis TaxID=584605 RepID=A0ABN1IIA4_9FLAO
MILTRSNIIFSLILTLLISASISAQYQITIDAFVKDSSTQQPIPFVNVGFIGKGIGTVSDQDGRIFLQYDEGNLKPSDIIQFSSLGFETVQLSINQMFEMLTKSNTIFMKPTVYELEAAEVVAEKRKKKTIGNAYEHTGIIGYWKEAQALGGEIATRIRVRHKNTKLLKLKFHIHENISDSLLVRVNIYESKKRKPGKNILTSNIYHTITKKKGEETIDLSRYNIRVHDDIIVSLELIKVYGKEIEFSISASPVGRSYLRYISQDVWRNFRNVGMAFRLDISYPGGKEKLKKRETPKNIVMYWDTSMSASKNDVDKTIEFLKKYLKKIKNTTITFVTFSEKIHKQQQFSIQKGNGDELFKVIRELSYNGATNFEVLFKEEALPDQYLVISDGYANYGKSNVMYDVPVFYINHMADANDQSLQKAAILSEGYYINLNKISADLAISNILNEVDDTVIYDNDNTEELVSGIVSSNGVPVQGCKVSVKGSLIQTSTNAQGAFTINAKNQDILRFEFFGLIPQEITLDARKTISIDLTSQYTVLEEVAIDTKKTSSNDEEFDTGSQKIKKRALGYATYTLEADEFPKSAIYLADLIRGRFPGVQVSGFGNDATYLIRGNNSFFNDRQPLFVVDGAIFQTTPIFLQPANIKRISVINGLAGATRYGEAGRGGVFIITTTLENNVKNETPVNDLLVKGNDYNKSTFLLDQNKNRPSYLDTLWNSTSYVEAKKVYYELRKEYETSIPFYMYCSSYFKIWDIPFSNEILSNIAEIGQDNPQALRVLAFSLEANKKYKHAEVIYERIKVLAPYEAQSYLDLARIYAVIKKYQPAFEIYKKVLRNEESGIDFKGVTEQAESEVRRLLSLYRNEITYQDVPKRFLKLKEVPVRLVFEWNDPQSEFEIQFVNPKNKFYEWQYEYNSNKEEVLANIQSGVFSKEFTIDKAIPGQWIINIQALGEFSKINPGYIKYTVYTNYGTTYETKKVQCISLYNQKEKVTLDKIPL